MNGTARLALPFLSPGQAQKEFIHNEALQQLDIVAAAAVEEEPRTDPPATPVIGACYIVGSPASGSWAEQDHCLAGFTTGGWRFVPPLDGLTAFVKSRGCFATFIGGSWDIGGLKGARVEIEGAQVVGTRAAAIAEPADGPTIDAGARDTIGQILVVLRHHGLIAS